MESCKFFIEDTNRLNIRYATISTKQCQLTSLFDWLVHQVRQEGVNTPKVIVFCQAKAQCVTLYEYFEENLGIDHMYYTPNDELKDDRTRLVGMYHHGTREPQKLSAEKAFTSVHGTMRVLFCTSSFGLGVNVKNCHLVIHLGPTKMVDEYLQESGRVGRDGSQSHSILILYPYSTSGPGFELEMKNIVANNEKCRRKMLMDAVDNPHPLPKVIAHTCCDICALSCKCLCICSADTCACDPRCTGLALFQSLAEKEIYKAASLEKSKIEKLPVMYVISETDRDMLQCHLWHIKDKILNAVNDQNFITKPDICTGFTDDLVEDIVHKVEYISSLDILLEYFPFFNISHATEVYDCIQRLFSTQTIELLDHELDCVLDLSSSDESDQMEGAMDDNEDDCEDEFSEYRKPNLHDSDSDSKYSAHDYVASSDSD